MTTLYFTFPDGVFDHRCDECPALCCRGHGVEGSLKREMGALLELYPRLGSMVRSQDGAVLTLVNPGKHCQFLRSDLLCSIEVEHGRALKPGGCVLFPFNTLSRLGRRLVVSPNFLCPLRVHTPPRPGEVEGTHARIAAALAETRLGDDLLSLQDDRPPRPFTVATLEALFAREEAFRDACTAALGTSAFRTLLESAPGWESAAGLLARVEALFGLDPAGVSSDPAAPPDELDRLLLAVAPSFRFRMLACPAEGLLLGLALGERLVREVAALSQVPPAAQGVWECLQTAEAMLRLAGRSQVRLSPRAARVAIPASGDPALTFAAFRLQRGAAGGPLTLDLLEEAAAGLEGRAARTLFLSTMAQALEKVEAWRG